MSSSSNSHGPGFDITVSGLRAHRLPPLLPQPSSASHSSIHHQLIPNQAVADPETIICIGLPTGSVSNRLKSRVEALEKMVMLTHSWLRLHIRAQVNKRVAEGSLALNNASGAERERVTRAQMRAWNILYSLS